jgi:putative RecB family exonuclease
MTQLTEPRTLPDELQPVVLGSLSPSRAADFKACPLMYRFRCIDRLREAPSPVATRGTVVHAVLERLFDLPSADRTLAAAKALLPEAWERVRAEDPDVAGLFAEDVDGAQFAAWLESAATLLESYFALEDPRRIEPQSRELAVDVVIEGVRLRGVIDRVDVAPDGAVRIVDYKTGASPREAFEGKALFQMKFYALVLWRLHGIVPRQLRLIYLADTDTLSYQPEAEELVRFERTLIAIWRAIERAMQTGDFRPNPGPLCEWCDHQALCPAFGGTPPPFPHGAPLTDPRDDVPAAG